MSKKGSFKVLVSSHVHPLWTKIVQARDVNNNNLFKNNNSKNTFAD